MEFGDFWCMGLHDCIMALEIVFFLFLTFILQSCYPKRLKLSPSVFHVVVQSVVGLNVCKVFYW